MENTLVTIGITAFNARETIARAVDSALQQDWDNKEIVVVDDSSTDNTAAVVEAIAGSVPRLRLVRHPENRGVAAARNTILAHASGEFVAFFDDDDISDPTRIRTQLQRIRSYEQSMPTPAPVVCHTARRQVLPDGSEHIEQTMGILAITEAPYGEAVAQRILMGRSLQDGYGSCATCSQMARLDAYRDVGGFDEALRRSEDTDMIIRLALVGAHFVGVAEPLVHQTLSVNSHKQLQTEFDFAMTVLRKHVAAFPVAKDFRFSCEWLALKSIWLQGKRTRFLLGLASLCVRHPARAAHRMREAGKLSQSRAARRRLHKLEIGN